MVGGMTPTAAGRIGVGVARSARINSRVRPVAFWALQFCALAMLSPAMAQVLKDPTRPPDGVLQAAPGEAGAAATSLLQSVKISGSEKTAIIGGQTVKLGGKYGDARVVKITESEVVLRSATGTETLRMYPDVNMKAIEPPPVVPTKPAKKRNRKPAAITQGKQG
jgi:MSHA biogenesis protein MshK